LIKQADLPTFMTPMSSDSTKSVYEAIFNDQRQSWTHGGDLGCFMNTCLLKFAPRKIL